ncbi:MAG TPA: tRNA 2-thiouridine(34) synthase MnmA [Synergistales bacterium]|nr:tRNA 2-thiouridine(34) synthase MnmA [Synergistales bacterium]HQQ10930.1 tRNA 2-thiouridine(34) synthase MnmA [Synergistales bacterium]
MKAVVGISGGMDSAAAAALMLDRGFEVIGVHLRFRCSREEENRVERITSELGIGLLSLDVESLFNSKVRHPFFDALRKGFTPNPCVICNEQVKFVSLVSAARGLGAELVATGHYARVSLSPDKGTALLRGVDPEKDQSYMLYRIPVSILEKTCFPLGGITKREVRAFCEERFPALFEGVAESSDICFIPGRKLEETIELNAGPFIPGRIVTTSGEELGHHRGLNRYTIGQRKGLSLSGGPWFVVEKRMSLNELVVGRQEDLVVEEVFCTDPVWHLEPATGERLDGCHRYRCRPSPCILEQVNDRYLSCRFPEGVSGVAPGQSLVFYYNDRVYGGAIIERAEKGGPPGLEDHR